MDDPDLKQVIPHPNNPEGLSEPPAEQSPNDPDPFTPPVPGQVINSEPAPSEPAPSGSIQPPGAEVPTPPAASSQPGGGKRWLKMLVWLIILALIAAGGWLAYQKYVKKSPASSTTAQSKDIPLLKIGVLQAAYGKLYPDMSLNEYSYLTNSQIFEGLVRYENKSKLVPDLASTWTNPDSKTWLFTVKSGVKFHDGHTLAASDVKYSLDTLIASKSDIAQTFADTIASVDVVGSNQVKITTTDPDPALLNKLVWLYVIDANLPKGGEPSLAGTGPYEVKPGTTPSDSRVQMVAFNGYHGGTPKTKALDFGSGKDDATLVKAFQAHQYDIVGQMQVSDVQAVSGAKQFITSEADAEFIAFNTIKPGPLHNKLVREAIRYAVSAAAIGKASGSQVTPLSQLIPEPIPGYNPAITPYKQDIAKAKKLLAQAGYPNGVTIRFSTSAGDPVVNEIVSELKQAGITATLDRHANFDEFISYFGSGQAEVYSIDYSSDTLDGLDIYTTTLNDPNYSNPKLTALLGQASTETNPAKRLKLLQDAAVIVDQDIPVVPLYSQSNLWLMDKPYAIQQDMPSSLISVYFYKVHQ
jgi:peptide/nickel transport system substrate-binding protein